MLTGDIGDRNLTKQQKIDLFVKNRIKDSYMIRNRGTIFN
jgi:hypothetical protein